jgi:uncharacterized membrane protein YvbJ
MKKHTQNDNRKICPKCKTKNLRSNRFCKKCGFAFSRSLKDKRRSVLTKKKRVSLRTSILLALTVVFLGWIGSILFQGSTGGHPAISLLPQVSEGVSYLEQNIEMAEVEATVENGKISLSLDDVLDKKIVRYEYDNNGYRLPLLAYITPSGKAVTAVSMCEPCRSTHFHIRGKSMVCNACDTEWNLETLRGIRGGCLTYPPDFIPSTIENGRIWIDEQMVSRWRPRI